MDVPLWGDCTEIPMLGLPPSSGPVSGWMPVAGVGE